MKNNIKFLLNIIFSLIISTALNATMYIENVAPDNTDSLGRLIPGGIDLENVEVKCWNGGNWGPDKIAKNSYLTHECGSSSYYENGEKRTFAPADLYYKGQAIGQLWWRDVSVRKTKAGFDTGFKELSTVKRGTLDSMGNPHYCLKMVNGNLTVTYNGENNCPRVSPMANLFSLVRK